MPLLQLNETGTATEELSCQLLYREAVFHRIVLIHDDSTHLYALLVLLLRGIGESFCHCVGFRTDEPQLRPPRGNACQ